MSLSCSLGTDPFTPSPWHIVSLFSAQASTMAPAPLQPFTDSQLRSSSRLPSLLMALHHAPLSMVEPGIFDPSSLTQISLLALRPHPSWSDQPIPFTWDFLVFSLDNPTSREPLSPRQTRMAGHPPPSPLLQMIRAAGTSCSDN